VGQLRLALPWLKKAVVLDHKFVYMSINHRKHKKGAPHLKKQRAFKVCQCIQQHDGGVATSVVTILKGNWYIIDVSNFQREYHVAVK
jgi:hypothetical protein